MYWSILGEEAMYFWWELNHSSDLIMGIDENERGKDRMDSKEGRYVTVNVLPVNSRGKNLFL